MVWGSVKLPVQPHAFAALVGLTFAAAMAPNAAMAKSQPGGAEVVYFDPMAMTPQAKLASQTGGRSLLSQTFSVIEAYPDKKAPLAPRAATPQNRIANLDQRDFVKIGAPYRQNGVWYVPANETDYDETGTASWYGPDFHGKETSNGEAFNMDVISAAHPTLPLPCIVEVTNLENGRTLKVRVNDRGPFMDGRLIDLSRRGAQELGYYGKGSAKVRVRYVGPADADDSVDKFANTTRQFQPAALQTISYREPVRTPAPIRQAALPAPKKPVAQAPVASKPTPKRERVGGSTPVGGRYLQIGAFSSAANADKLRAKLGVAPVKIVVINQNSGALYRVVMGPFADQMAMDQARATAIDVGVSSPRVVDLN
jgi:rare lipoprotein A